MKITSTENGVTMELQHDELMFLLCDSLTAIVGKKVTILTILSLIESKSNGERDKIDQFLRDFNADSGVSPYRKKIVSTLIPLIIREDNVKPLEELAHN